MDAIAAGLIAVEALFLGILVLGERRDSPALIWTGKSLASAAFVGLAIAVDATASSFGVAILAALVLSLVGDVLLVPRDARVFRASILAFLLAHVAFIVAFVERGVAWTFAAASLLAVVPMAVVIGRWILPRVPRPLLPAVVAYMVVISAMVAAAVGAAGGGASWWIAACAFAFYANDVLVARDRFVGRAFWHRGLGLPIYYGAQTGFALLAGAA